MPTVEELFDIITPTRPPGVIPDAPEKTRKGRYQVPESDRVTAAEIDRVSTTALDAQLNVGIKGVYAPIILGRCRVGPVLTWATTYANELIVVLLWGRSGAEGYDAIETLSMGNAALPAAATVVHYLGNQTTVDPTLAALLLAYGAGTLTNPMTGVCYTVLTLPARDYSSGFPGGYPVNIAEFHAIIRGLKCYDAGLSGTQSAATPSTWTWTDNPARIVARLCSDVTLGAGIPASTAAWTSVLAAVNHNNGTLTGGGVTKRFTLNTVLAERAPAETHIKALAAYGSFFVVPDNGSFTFVIDDVATVGAAITEAGNDIIPGSFRYTGLSNKNRSNLVFVQYTLPHPFNVHGAWEERTAPVGADIPALPSGETRRANVLPQPGITTYDQALRAAKALRGHDYTEDLTFTFQMKQKALELLKGDVRPITASIFTSKNMRLLSAEPSSERGVWDTTWKEYDAAAYNTTWTTSPSTPDTLLPNPFGTPPAVTGLTLTEIVPGGLVTSLSQIGISFTASTWPYLDGYGIEITDDDATAPQTVWTTFVRTTEVVSIPLRALKKYRVYVTPLSVTQIAGPSVNDSITLVETSDTYQVVFTKTVTTSGWISFENYTVAHPVSSTFTFGLGEIFDLGTVRSAYIECAHFAAFAAANAGNYSAYLDVWQEMGPGSVVLVPFDGAAGITGRYFRLRASGAALSAPYNPQTGVWTAKMLVQARATKEVADSGGPVTVFLEDRYVSEPTVQLTTYGDGGYVTEYENLSAGNEYIANAIQIGCRDLSGTRVDIGLSMLVTGVRSRYGVNRIDNIATGGYGTTATASSAGGGNPASAANDGVRDSSIGSWSATGAQPQWLELDFGFSATLSEIVLYFLPDAPGTSNEPTVFDVATLYHATEYRIDYWDGAAWVTISGTATTGNTKVMRRHLVSVTTTKILVVIIASPDGGSRLVEVECFSPA